MMRLTPILCAALTALAAREAQALGAPRLLQDPDNVQHVTGAPTALALTPAGLVVSGPADPLAGSGPLGLRTPLADIRASALALAPGGVLLAADARTLTALTTEGRALWTAPLPGAPEGLVAGADGRALALVGGRVIVVSPDGVVEQTWSLGPGTWTSLIYDASRRQVVAAGDVETTACGEGLAAARVRATDLAGAPRWDALGETLGRERWDRCRDLASTHAVGLALDDDTVLVAAEVERGGGDLFRVTPDGAPARLSVIDAASDPDSAGDAPFAFYARLSADHGIHLRGQYLVPPDGAEAVRPQAIALDRFGHVYLAGVLHVLPREDQAPGLADNELAFVQGVTPDFSARPLWWTFAPSDHAATARVHLAAARDDLLALAVASDGEAAVVRWQAERDLANPVGWVGKKEDRPDPDTMELFGYESGASASNDDCFCSAEPRPLSAISILGVLALAGLQRRRR